MSEKSDDKKHAHVFDGSVKCTVCGQDLWEWASEAVLHEVKGRAADKNRCWELENELIAWKSKCAHLEQELAEDVKKILELGQERDEIQRENDQMRRATKQYEAHLKRKLPT